jgi:hypothetical protein
MWAGARFGFELDNSIFVRVNDHARHRVPADGIISGVHRELPPYFL